MKRSENEKTKNISIYVHIPFCVSKCNYCDFISYADMNSIVPLYFNALRQEIQVKLAEVNVEEQYICRSIFFGGGTPSYVDSQYIRDVLKTIQSKISLSNDCEITIEANPGTITEDKLNSYLLSGVNRISVGLQAWQDRLLNYMGRAHDITQFIDNIEKIKKLGFNNINVDLIYGLPTQTFKEWQETLNEVARLGINHISCYSLKLEEGTNWYERYQKRELPEIDEDLEREMYRYAQELFAKQEILQYEISNFAKVGWECKHNIVYWTLEEYLGFGAGAHSYINQTRYSNIADLKEYVDRTEANSDIIAETIRISMQESIIEYIILGLRLNKGVSLNEFKRLFGLSLSELFYNQIERLTKQGLVYIDKHTIRLTRKGLDFANQAFIEFMN